MKIIFTLDDVIRNKTVQFGKIYKKYIKPELDLSTLDLSSGNLQQIFNFENKKAFEKFLYEDYSFEIFAEAIPCEKQLDKKLNLWLLSLQDYDEDEYEKLEFAISNPYEFNNSIGYSYFFVSKIATRIREVFFPADSSEIWKKGDVVITADPKLLELPDAKNKVSVKINTEYNENVKADLTYDSLISLLNDNDFIEKIIELNKQKINNK